MVYLFYLVPLALKLTQENICHVLYTYNWRILVVIRIPREGEDLGGGNMMG